MFQTDIFVLIMLLIELRDILNWLTKNQDSFSTFICQHEQMNLFASSQEQWNEEDADKFIFEINKFWNEW